MGVEVGDEVVQDDISSYTAISQHHTRSRDSISALISRMASNQGLRWDDYIISRLISADQQAGTIDNTDPKETGIRNSGSTTLFTLLAVSWSTRSLL